MVQMFRVHQNEVGNFHQVHLFHFVADAMMADVQQILDEQNLGADQTFPDAVHLFQNLVHLLDVAVDAEFRLLKMDYFLHVVQEDVVHRMDYFQVEVQVLMDVVRSHLMVQKAQRAEELL